MSVLITSPDYEETTHYLSTYVKEIEKFALTRGLKVFCARRPKLTQANITKFIMKNDPNLLLFHGHGDAETIYGDKIKGIEEPLIQEGLNHTLLEGKLTYALSCWAAASLGKTATNVSGCFIGYHVPFQFLIDNIHVASPLKDKMAKHFLDTSNLLAESLLKGNSAQKAAETFQNCCKKNMLKLLSKNKEPGAMQAVKILWMNMNGIDVLGNGNLTIMNSPRYP